MHSLNAQPGRKSEANSKEGITTMKTTGEKIAFANDIDFTELFRHAEIFTGTVLKFSEPEVTECRDNVNVKFRSENIAGTCGAFGKILEYCHVEPFAHGVTENDETGELRYWAKINLDYRHVDGGHNGMELFWADYSNGKWEFRDAGR